MRGLRVVKFEGGVGGRVVKFERGFGGEGCGGGVRFIEGGVL